MTGHLDGVSMMGITHYLHSKVPFWGSWLCDLWTPGYQLVYVPLFSSIADCIFPQHHVMLHLATILVCRHLLWTDFPSLWCQPPFLHWWYTYICLWFWASFVFLGLAGIKSLMFQNHIQLKLCKTEFLVTRSLTLQTQSTFLFLFWPLLTSNFTSKGYQGGYLWLIIVFLISSGWKPVFCHGNIARMWVFLCITEAGSFSVMIYIFLRAGHLHSWNGPGWATFFLTLTLHHVLLAC